MGEKKSWLFKISVEILPFFKWDSARSLMPHKIIFGGGEKEEKNNDTLNARENTSTACNYQKTLKKFEFY